LEIKEQPTSIFRYRYETEMQGPHGTIQSKQTKRTLKTFPTVCIKNFDSPARVMIRCCLYQIERDEVTGHRNLHPHRLVSRTGDFQKFDPHMHEVSKENHYTAV
jgi:Rel homology DNA-binding domain